MQVEVFTPDDLSSASLLAVFDAAMFDVALVNDGDLQVRDKYQVFVSPHVNKTSIRFLAIFGVRESAGEEAGFALCNRINDGLIIIRASMNNPTTLAIDWYLPVTGGIGKKAVVLALRKFNELLGSTGDYDTDNIIE